MSVSKKVFVQVLSLISVSDPGSFVSWQLLAEIISQLPFIKSSRLKAPPQNDVIVAIY